MHQLILYRVFTEILVQVKVKFTLEQATKAERESRVIYSSTVSLTSALDRGGWSIPRLGRFSAGKETRYPMYRRLGGRRSRSG